MVSSKHPLKVSSNSLSEVTETYNFGLVDFFYFYPINERDFMLPKV